MWLAKNLNPATIGWPDARDAWPRFVIRSGYRATARRPWRGKTRGIVAGVVIAATAAGVALSINRGPGTDLVTRMYHLSVQDRHTPKAPNRRDLEFARSLATLEAKGELQQLSDDCCADRDGEGPADDGVLTVRLAGSRSPVVILYEDTQRAGQFLPGDVVLIVSRPGLSAGDALLGVAPTAQPLDPRE